jgi:CRP-like cAMP-binding protein
MTNDVAFPTLTGEQLDRLAPYGTTPDVAASDELFRAGDRGYDFIVILDGSVSIIQPDGDGAVSRKDCEGRLCFIGAEAATSWVPPEVALDDAGFVPPTGTCPRRSPAGRPWARS